MTDKLLHTFDRLQNLVRQLHRQAGIEHGLQPIHVDALIYLSQCNRYSDQPKVVTEYLGLTKGTVSQTLKLLESKGFIEKKPDKRDKRVTHLALTDSGRSLVQQWQPAPTLQAAIDRLETAQREQLSGLLTTLLRGVQQEMGQKGFGVCQNCRFHQVDGKQRLCGLTGDELSSSDAEKLCREYEDDLG